MISINGLPSLTGLNLVDRTRDKQLEMIRSSSQHARAIEHFKENIKNVETVDQLLDDQELYSFVMRAFDLEDQIFGKGMIRKVLESNIEESGALVNRLTDTRFRDMYQEMGFGKDGQGNINTILTSWQDRMVDRYVERQFINNAWDGNETVATALEFRKVAGDIENPLDILKDRTMTSFFQTVFGLPKQLSGLDIDKQIEIVDAKVDFEKLKDPAEVEKMIRKYVAISDALNGTAASTNAAVQMLSMAANNSQSLIRSITVGISPISFYRGY